MSITQAKSKEIINSVFEDELCNIITYGRKTSPQYIGFIKRQNPTKYFPAPTVSYSFGRWNSTFRSSTLLFRSWIYRRRDEIFPNYDNPHANPFSARFAGEKAEGGSKMIMICCSLFTRRLFWCKANFLCVKTSGWIMQEARWKIVMSWIIYQRLPRPRALSQCILFTLIFRCPFCCCVWISQRRSAFAHFPAHIIISQAVHTQSESLTNLSWTNQILFYRRLALRGILRWTPTRAELLIGRVANLAAFAHLCRWHGNKSVV